MGCGSQGGSGREWNEEAGRASNPKRLIEATPATSGSRADLGSVVPSISR
jgi:hypothetical protein